MGIYDNYATDPEAERRGVILDFGDYWVRVARAGGANTAFIKAVEAALKPFRRAIELGTLSEKKAQEIGFPVFAEHIVKEWGGEGLVNRAGEPIPYSQENCIKLFHDLPDFFLTIKNYSEEAASFRRSAMKEEAGN